MKRAVCESVHSTLLPTCDGREWGTVIRRAVRGCAWHVAPRFMQCLGGLARAESQDLNLPKSPESRNFKSRDHHQISRLFYRN